MSLKIKRRKLVLYTYKDERYEKYLKRVRNRQKLYNKLKKLGRV